MATVLEARSSDGSLIGRCGAKCHTAKGKKCKCICAGKNHGQGFEQALENSEEFRQDSLGGVTYVTRPRQGELFTLRRGPVDP